MEIIIFFIIVAALSYIIASYKINREPKRFVDDTQYEFKQAIKSEKSWNEKHKRFSHEGIQRMSISGLSYRGIELKDIGYFDGYLVKEHDNQYDKYAIAIYCNTKKIGYIPKSENRQLAKTTDVNYKSVFGYIEPYCLHGDTDQISNISHFSGEVFIPISATEGQVDKYKEKLKSMV